MNNQERLNDNMLISPIPKKNSAFKKEAPFPIIRNNDEGEQNPDWNIVEGYLQEDCVLVYDEESIKLLYTHGFFGKGTLSKNAPKVCFENTEDNEDNHPQQDPSSEKPEIEVIEIDEDDDEEQPKPKISKIEEIVLSDSSISDTERDFFPPCKMVNSKELAEEREKLQLTFEEAYFLSFGLGCLIVKDKKDQFISLTRLWNIFCESTREGNFPAMYTAYHHFRSKGWVVKTGVKYGVDYILYKDGPPFYHATYSVIVKPIRSRNFRDAQNSKQMTWPSLFALNRLNICSNKGLLFLYVIKPTTLTESQMSTPLCISFYTVKEVLFKRWVPEENREES